MSLRSVIGSVVLVSVATASALAYREYVAFNEAVGQAIAEQVFADGLEALPAAEEPAAPPVAADNDEFAGAVAQTERAPVEAEQPRARRVLVMLKSREHVVTVYSGLGRPEGQQFTVSSLEGDVLAAQLSLADFEDRYPLLYDFYRTSFAEAWAGTDFDRGN